MSRLRTDTWTVAIPSLSAGAYTTGQTLGQKFTITDYDAEKTVSGVIHSVVLSDKAANSSNADIIFFDESPSQTTFSNTSALNLADGDLNKVVGIARLTAHNAMSTSSQAFLHGANIPFRLRSGVQLEGVAVARAAYTLASVSDLLVKIGILED